MELNGEYSTPHLSAHTATDRRIIMHQMAVNGPQNAFLIWVSSSPQALCNLSVCFTVVCVNVYVFSVYTLHVYSFHTLLFFVYMVFVSSLYLCASASVCLLSA